jgi:hypothetical protein
MARTLDTSNGNVRAPQVFDPQPPSSVDRVVLRLNAICKTTTFEFAMSVGKLVVDSFYGGDPLVWRQRGPKSMSFRKLARHPDLPMSPAALYRSVAIYELSCRLGVASWKHLSTSHLRLVLSLPEHAQSELLLRAESEAWSVARLRAAIDEGDVGKNTNLGGRKKQPRLRKTLGMIARCVTKTNRLVGVDDSDVEFSPESARCVVELLTRTREACAALECEVSRNVLDAQDNEPSTISSVQGRAAR